jgi:DNA polymerase I
MKSVAIGGAPLPATLTSVWACDFEFNGGEGERPRPVCMVARDSLSGREIRLWRNELRRLYRAPFPVDESVLLVAYNASAELSCFLELGWQMPARVLDLYAEFRLVTNSDDYRGGRSQLDALHHYGLSAITAGDKESMRQLILKKNDWDEAEQVAILNYCAEDVDALIRLLPAMAPKIDWLRAMLRGRYMGAVARMVRAGVPIDLPTYSALRNNWTSIKALLVADVDRQFNVYEGVRFSAKKFEQYLASEDIPWPRLSSGDLALDKDTFKERVTVYPRLAALRELRVSLDDLRLTSLAIGSDGRNRAGLFPFSAKTGRNQPSNAQFIFGPSRWLRGLIKPEPGHGLAYIDYSSQEIGIAAALSGDAVLNVAYQSGDPYLAFARQIGLVPPTATKETHPVERSRCKAIVLGTNYGMTAKTLAFRTGMTEAEARQLLDLHRRHYRDFWGWAQRRVDSAMLTGVITASFGWAMRVSRNPNGRSLLNWSMQANGAEMLRLACIGGTEAGIEICAPVHDALLIHAPFERLQADVARMQEIMVAAGRAVLAGYELRTDAEIIRWPNRYMDERGERMWKIVMSHLNRTTGRVAA